MESIIDTVRKLMELAKSPNEHEAKNAAAHADRLIQKHRIDTALLEQNPEFDTFDLLTTGRVTMWKQTLFTIIARNYGCFPFIETTNASGRKVTTFKISGTKEDRDIVINMFNWCSAHVEYLAKTFAYGKGKVFCNSYAIGIVNGIYFQFSENKKKQEADACNTSAMVILDGRSKKAEEFITSKTKMSKVDFKSQSHVDANAYSFGFDTGKRIQFNKHLGE